MFIKKWQLVSSLVVLLLTASGFCWWKFYLHPKQTLFQSGKIAENFSSMESIFPSKTIAKSTNPFKLQEKIRELNVSYKFGGKTYTMPDLLDRTFTTGILVVKNDAIVYEQIFKVI